MNQVYFMLGLYVESPYGSIGFLNQISQTLKKKCQVKSAKDLNATGNKKPRTNIACFIENIICTCKSNRNEVN